MVESFQTLSSWYPKLAAWLNENQGVFSLITFCVALILPCVGIALNALRNRRGISITAMEGPTFCCTFNTGGVREGHPVHKTAIALYLCVANKANSATSIKSIMVGYPIGRSACFSLRHNMYWLNQSISLHDFCVRIKDNIKFYPYLTQKSTICDYKVQTYLEVGREIRGVTYFEQDESWGNWKPQPKDGKVTLWVKVEDIFDKIHYQRLTIPVVTLEQAKLFAPEFGNSIPRIC